MAALSQLAALLLSVLVEAAVAAALLAGLHWGSPGRGALAATVGTLATHWAVWAFMRPVTEAVGYWPALAIVEGLVVLAEAPAYRLIARQPWPRALLLSLLANVASTGVGLIYYALI